MSAPPRIRANSVNVPPIDEEIPACEIQLRKGHVACASMIGRRKFPSTVGMEGIRKNQTMITPWIVNRRLYMSVRTRPPVGFMKMQADHGGGDPANHKKERDRDHEKDPDPLVIGRSAARNGSGNCD